MKKLGIVLLILVGGLFVARKTNVVSYVCTAWGKLKEGVKKQVPLEFEVERVRHEITKLDDDMRDQLGPVAEEMASVKALKKRILVTRQNLKDEKSRLLTMAKDLERGDKFITYGDEEFTAEEVRGKLDRDFVSYKRAEAELKSLEQVLTAKEISLRSVRTQLSGMRALKRDLEVQLAQLEAELKAVRLAQTRDKYQLDDSRLSDIKASLADIEHRIEVERSKAELNGQLGNDPIPVKKKTRPANELTREVQKYFSAKSLDKEGKAEVVKK